MSTPPIPPKPPQYMSYVSNRRKVWATHNELGHLKNSLGGCLPSKMAGSKCPEMFAYELKDSEYVLMWHIEGGTPIEELPWETTIYQPRKIPKHSRCHCSDCL